MDYNTQKAILESKFAILESKRLLREFAEDPVDMSDALATQSANNAQLPANKPKQKGLAGAVAKGVAGAAVEKAAVQGAKTMMTKAAAKYGLQTIPGYGSILAFFSTIAQAGLFLKELVTFTDKLLELTGEELTGVRSLIGEYSILDANPEDMKRIAAAIAKLDQRDVVELNKPYKQMEVRFKRTVIDLMFSIKELSIGVSLGVAAALILTPSQTLKDILFKSSQYFTDLKNKAPGFVSFLIDLGEFAAGSFIPVIGFISDKDRIAAFGEIDDAIRIGLNKSTRDQALDHVEDVTQAGVVGYDALANVDLLGIGDSVASGISSMAESRQRSPKLLNFDKFLK